MNVPPFPHAPAPGITSGPGPASAPPPGPAPGPAPGTDLGADFGAALRFTGQGLLRAPGPTLGAAAVHGVLFLVVLTTSFIGMLLAAIAMVEASPTADGELSLGQTLVVLALSLVMVLVTGVVGALWQAGSARAAEVLADGGRPSFVQALLGSARVIVTGWIVFAAVTAGTILMYLPGLVAAFALFYAIPAAQRGASPFAAIVESVRTAFSRPGLTALGVLFVIVASYVCGIVVIGLLVLIPATVLLQTGLYERIQGRALPVLARP